MRPLTETTAKPLLKIGGHPLLDYTFDALPDAIGEVIVVIGYLGGQIKAYLGENFKGRTIQYVEKKAVEGTAKALFETRPLLHKKFLVLMADDIYTKADIGRCFLYERAILVKKSNVVGPGGEVLLDEHGRLKEVIEGKNHQAGTLISTNVFVLDQHIFEYEPVKLVDREGEWGLPQTVAKMAEKFPVAVVMATRWIKITTPEDLKTAEQLLGSYHSD